MSPEKAYKRVYTAWAIYNGDTRLKRPGVVEFHQLTDADVKLAASYAKGNPGRMSIVREVRKERRTMQTESHSHLHRLVEAREDAMTQDPMTEARKLAGLRPVLPSLEEAASGNVDASRKALQKVLDAYDPHNASVAKIKPVLTRLLGSLKGAKADTMKSAYHLVRLYHQRFREMDYEDKTAESIRDILWHASKSIHQMGGGAFRFESVNDLDEEVRAGQYFVLVDISMPGGKLASRKLYRGTKEIDKVAEKMNASGHNIQVIDAKWFKPSYDIMYAQGMVGKPWGESAESEGGALTEAKTYKKGQSVKLRLGHPPRLETYKVLRYYPTKAHAEGPFPTTLTRLMRKDGGALLVELQPGKKSKEQDGGIHTPGPRGGSWRPKHYIVYLDGEGNTDGAPVDLKPHQFKRVMSYKESTESTGSSMVERVNYGPHPEKYGTRSRIAAMSRAGRAYYLWDGRRWFRADVSGPGSEGEAKLFDSSHEAQQEIDAKAGKAWKRQHESVEGEDTMQEALGVPELNKWKIKQKGGKTFYTIKLHGKTVTVSEKGEPARSGLYRYRIFIDGKRYQRPDETEIKGVMRTVEKAVMGEAMASGKTSYDVKAPKGPPYPGPNNPTDTASHRKWSDREVLLMLKSARRSLKMVHGKQKEGWRREVANIEYEANRRGLKEDVESVDEAAPKMLSKLGKPVKVVKVGVVKIYVYHSPKTGKYATVLQGKSGQELPGAEGKTPEEAIAKTKALMKKAGGKTEHVDGPVADGKVIVTESVQRFRMLAGIAPLPRPMTEARARQVASQGSKRRVKSQVGSGTYYLTSTHGKGFPYAVMHNKQRIGSVFNVNGKFVPKRDRDNKQLPYMRTLAQACDALGYGTIRGKDGEDHDVPMDATTFMK